MPKLSDKKREKISENILSLLYHSFPNPLFTSKIADEAIRDEEFTKSLLKELEKKGLVELILKNHKGIKYSRRMRWRLSNKAHKIYSAYSTA